MAKKKDGLEKALEEVGKQVEERGNPFGVIGSTRRSSTTMRASTPSPKVVSGPKTNTGGLAGRKRREASVSKSSKKRHSSRVRKRQRRAYS